MFTTSERVLRFAARATDLKPWILALAVIFAVLPGVPTAVIYAMAGWAGMRLLTFLLLDLTGALLVTALIAALGYWTGQQTVDVVLLIDKYATAASLTLILLAVTLPLLKRLLRPPKRSKPDPAHQPPPDEEPV